MLRIDVALVSVMVKMMESDLATLLDELMDIWSEGTWEILMDAMTESMMEMR